MGWLLDRIDSEGKKALCAPLYSSRQRSQHYRALSHGKCLELRNLLGTLIPVKKKPLKTEYTGMIRSTEDLRYWADKTGFKYHCERCSKGISIHIKTHNKGFCNDCRSWLLTKNRCCICFEEIRKLESHNHNTNSLSLVCCECHAKFQNCASNSHGYEEGGKLGGGLRTNYWVDNENDDIAKICEG